MMARRREALRYLTQHWKKGIFGGIATMGSYGLALWAMTLAPLAVVAALRETSILFGALIAATAERAGGGVAPGGCWRDCRWRYSVTPVLELKFGNICCRFLFTYPAVHSLSIPAHHLAFFFSVVDFTRIYGNA